MRIVRKFVEEYLSTPADRTEALKSLAGLAATVGLWAVAGVLLWGLQ